MACNRGSARLTSAPALVQLGGNQSCRLTPHRRCMNVAVPLVLPLGSISASHLPAVGGKAANLGRMLALGLPAPAGFCVTAAAWRLFLVMRPPKSLRPRRPSVVREPSGRSSAFSTITCTHWMPALPTKCGRSKERWTRGRGKRSNTRRSKETTDGEQPEK